MFKKVTHQSLTTVGHCTFPPRRIAYLIFNPLLLQTFHDHQKALAFLFTGCCIPQHVLETEVVLLFLDRNSARCSPHEEAVWRRTQRVSLLPSCVPLGAVLCTLNGVFPMIGSLPCCLCFTPGSSHLQHCALVRREKTLSDGFVLNDSVNIFN
jgi:hypothetical protein